MVTWKCVVGILGDDDDEKTLQQSVVIAGLKSEHVFSPQANPRGTLGPVRKWRSPTSRVTSRYVGTRA